MNKTEKDTPIKNLDRALSVLDILASSSTPMSIMEISKALNTTRTTTYAMLSSLVGNNYVEKDLQTGRYTIGYKVLELADLYYHQYPFLYVTEKYVVSLAQKWSLKVNLSVLKDPGVCLLLASHDPGFMIPRMVVGHLMPAYACASGKVLLAACSDERIDYIIEHTKFVQHTSHTLATPEKLRNELEYIRANGYATEINELVLQRSCVAAPIQDRTGSVIAGISFSGHTDTIKQKLPLLTKEIISAAKQISTELGYNHLIF